MQMKVVLLMSLLSFQGSSACGGVTSSPAVAGGSPPASPCSHGGQGAPSLFPPSADQGLPQSAVGGEVAQTFRSHSEETSAKGQKGRLRNNEHLSNLSLRISASKGPA